MPNSKSYQRWFQLAPTSPAPPVQQAPALAQPAPAAQAPPVPEESPFQMFGGPDTGATSPTGTRDSAQRIAMQMATRFAEIPEAKSE